MAKLNIACLLAPMADTEGPMEIDKGRILKGAKKIIGKYGEVALEAAIKYGETFPNQTHLDILGIGSDKDLTPLQQNAIAMIQPGSHPGTLGVHALNIDDLDERDAFQVAGLLTAMIQKLENKPHLLFVGRESWDYAHGLVGPAVAQALGMPYFSGVNEVVLQPDLASVTATFIQGSKKVVLDIALPAVFGTTDWLNGKDTARFTSLKGVMAAKKFQRNLLPAGSVTSANPGKTKVDSIEPVKSERKNRKLADGEGVDKAKKAVDILLNQDKALVLDTKSQGSSQGSAQVSWQSGDAASLALANDVLVIADHDGAQIRLSTHQTLGQARKIADATGKKLSLLVFAKNADGLASACAGHGADRVIAIEASAFENPTLEACVKGFAQAVPGTPGFVFTAASDLGRDLAAFLAAQYGGGLLQDVVGLSLQGGSLVGKRIVSNARFQTSESILPGVTTQAVSVRGSAFDPIEDGRAVSFHKLALGELGLASKLKEVIAGAETKGIPLNEAKTVVSGGRGMKAADNFKALQELAELIGGAVGASRAVTDLGWVPHNLQIGQTGLTVAPGVYFAIGISGAIQHLTGMLGSKYIVAINPDADAPIHKHADLSIIDKWENVVPALTSQLKAALGK